MTTIPTQVHESLSTDERIRAAVSAIARGDDHELKTLSDTCPRKTYRMMDAAFGDGMENLKTLAIAVTSDLQGLALDFFISSRVEDPEARETALVVMASLEAAWCKVLADMGIDREEMAKATPARHVAVCTLLEIAHAKERSEIVEVHLAAMREHLAA